LRHAKRNLLVLGRSTIAVSLMLLLWLQLAMAASETLHKFIHADADQPGHECAVTLFAHGQVETSPVDVPVPPPATGVETTPQPVPTVFNAPDRQLPPGRGPPLSVLPA
jgi:hypothetical protein